MKELICDFCHKELKELGGLIFSPPDAYSHCKKRHICKPCYSNLTAPKEKYCSCEAKDPADDGSSKCMNCGLKINFKPTPKVEMIEELEEGVVYEAHEIANKLNELIQAHNRKEAGE